MSRLDPKLTDAEVLAAIRQRIRDMTRVDWERVNEELPEARSHDPAFVDVVEVGARESAQPMFDLELGLFPDARPGDEKLER